MELVSMPVSSNNSDLAHFGFIERISQSLLGFPRHARDY